MSLAPREIHTDPAPLVPVFEKCLTHKQIDDHKSLSHGEKTEKKKIQKWVRLLQLLFVIAANLSFRKTTVEDALRTAIPKLQQQWEKPLHYKHVEGWVKAAARRICNMCRHTSQAMVKGKPGKPTWAHKMLEGTLPTVAEMKPLEADVNPEEDAESEEESVDEKEEKTPTAAADAKSEEDAESEKEKEEKTPIAAVADYQIGCCRQARKAWRQLLAKKKKKEWVKVTPPTDTAAPADLLSATFAGDHTATLDVTVEEFKMQEALVAKEGLAKKMWKGKTPEDLALRIGRKADRSPMIVLYMQDSEGKEHIACVLRVQWLRSSLEEEAADRVAIEIMIEVAIEVAAGKLKTSPDMYKYRDRILKERGCIEKGTVDGAPAAAGCTKKQHEEKKGEAEPKKRAENKRKVSATDAPEKSKESAAAPKKAKTVAVVAAKKDEESPKKLEEEFFDSFASETEDGEVSPPDKIAGETAPKVRITGKVARLPRLPTRLPTHRPRLPTRLPARVPAKLPLKKL